MSLRVKLTLWYGLLLLVVLTLLAGIRYAGQRQLLQTQIDYGLRVVADIVDSSLPRRTPIREMVQKAVARIVKDYPDIELKGAVIEVYDGARRLIYSSSLSEEERLPLSDEMWRAAQRQQSPIVTSELPDGSEVRILTKPVFDRQALVYVIQVGNSSRQIDTSLQSSLLVNAIFIPAAILLVSLGGWWLTRRALTPLQTVIQTAHRISSGELSHRIEAAGYSEEIRELAQAFNQMIVRLEASFRQITDFSDNVSHELRIPLSILRGQTEVSLRRARSEEEYRHVLLSNLEEVQRMEKIVERLLFLSRATRGEITINRAPVDLRGLVSSVAAQFAVPTQQKPLHLTVEVPAEAEQQDLLHGPADATVMIGDELLLRELLLNLVQNAVTYTPAGGTVTLGLARREGRLELSVADTGCGIPPEEIPHIFERFYQVDRSRASQGSGLGLSLCQWIVEAHGGRIVVDSTVGRGSRFTVILPAPQ
jgi:two-component system OmpR family sensor kinase